MLLLHQIPRRSTLLIPAQIQRSLILRPHRGSSSAAAEFAPLPSLFFEQLAALQTSSRYTISVESDFLGPSLTMRV